MVLFPEGLKALKQVAKKVGLDLRGAYLNLDGGFDSTRHRKCIFNAGMIPNITENPRNRKTIKRGRKRFFNEAIHTLRARVERTFAWEDKFKRLLLRFAHMQQRHFGMKLMAYTLINLRGFCGGTGCEFSVAQKLLAWAKGYGDSGIRERYGQKNAWDSVERVGRECA
jgi:transposase